MFSNLPFPSLKAYFELVKAFQKSLVPTATSLFSTFHQPVSLQNFRFATGVSQNPTLSVAVVECVNQVQQKLGHGVHPNFCQLLVTDEPYGKHLSLAPRYVQEIFGTYGLKAPVLIGGAVEGLLGVPPAHLQGPAFGQQFSLRPAHGVSLLAAVLPGVTVHPFATETTALPGLPWDELLQVGLPGPQHGHQSAALVLSEPHFTQISELLGRIQSAMPQMPIVGGVLKHGAWGREFSRQRSMRGALFIGSEAVDSGAVGCIMSGPLQVDSICAQGCRPVGPTFTATAVHPEPHHNFVTELDGQPAHLVLAEAQRSSLNARDRLLRLQIGISSPSGGQHGGYVQVFPRPGPRGSIDVGTAEVSEGSRVRLHVQDPQWAQQEMKALLQEFAEMLPQEVRESPDSLGAFLYSCSAVTHSEASVLESALGDRLKGVPFQGAKVQGEIGHLLSDNHTTFSFQGGANSMLQSYCSSFGFMRQNTAAAARMKGTSSMTSTLRSL